MEINKISLNFVINLQAYNYLTQQNKVLNPDKNETPNRNQARPSHLQIPDGQKWPVPQYLGGPFAVI